MYGVDVYVDIVDWDWVFEVGEDFVGFCLGFLFFVVLFVGQFFVDLGDQVVVQWCVEMFGGEGFVVQGFCYFVVDVEDCVGWVGQVICY